MWLGIQGADANSAEDFNPLWISEFKKTNAFEVWDRTTDRMLFDIVEPRHPCNEKPSVVSDIGLRLSEGIQELKLEQQLAPTREAISRTLTAGSSGFFKAVEGVRGRWQRAPSSETRPSSVSSISSTPVEVSPPPSTDSNTDLAATPKDGTPSTPPPPDKPNTTTTAPSQTAPNVPRQHTSVDLGAAATHAAIEAKAAVGAWGAGIGSFWSTRAPRFSIPKVGTAFAAGSAKSSAAPSPVNTQMTDDGSPPPPPPLSKVEEPTTTTTSASPPPPTITAPWTRFKGAVAAVEPRQPEAQTELELHEDEEPPVKNLDRVTPLPSNGAIAGSTEV
jgi:hypothetical protein